jgi:uncharacterized damage-inducible protein DinB
MGEIARIGKQLERTYSGDPWHGPSLRSILEGIDGADASARPLPGAHSIAELAAHILAWREETLRRLEGKGRDLPMEENFPAPLPWSELLARLDRSHEALTKAVAALDEDVLDEKVEGRRESYYVLLQGIIHHDLYHAGQIAILKKGLSGHRA